MNWTREKPKEAGWYWWRRPMFADTEMSTIVVDVYEREGQLFVDRYDWVRITDGEWIGPISPTDRQQGRVAGLREAEEYARACVHERAVTLDGFTGSSAMAGVIRGKQSEAERIAEWCHKLAQQAQ
jgi:hypothetical protein